MLGNENINVAGRSFAELNENEMLEVIGGVTPNKDERGIIIISITKFICISAISGLLTYAVC